MFSYGEENSVFGGEVQVDPLCKEHRLVQKHDLNRHANHSRLGYLPENPVACKPRTTRQLCHGPRT